MNPNQKKAFANVLKGGMKGALNAPAGLGAFGSAIGAVKGAFSGGGQPSGPSMQPPQAQAAPAMQNATVNKPATTTPSSNLSATSPSSAKSSYATMLKSSGPIEQTAQQRYNTALQSFGQGQNAIYDKVQAAEFIPGQMESLNRAFGGQLEALNRDAQLEQERNKAAEDRRRWEMEFGLKAAKANGSGAGGIGSLFGNAKLSTGQKQDIADMLTVQRQVEGLEKRAGGIGKFIGAGPGAGINQFLARNTGSIRPGSQPGSNAQDVRNDIGQIKGYLAKLRGGTSFTPNEQALLDTYTPSVNDSDAVITSKLNSLKKYINDKIETTALVAGGSYNAPGQNNIVVAPDGQEIEIID